MPRSGPKTFVCTVCGKSIGRKPDLNRHEQIHKDDAVRFYCAYPGCHHSSLQKSNLKTHYIARHLRQRLHRCRFDGCTKSYSDASALIRHERSNHGFFRKAHRMSELTQAAADALIKVESPQTNMERFQTPSLYYSSSAPSPAPSDFSSMSYASYFEPSSVTYSQRAVTELSSTDAFLRGMIPELYPDPKFPLDNTMGITSNLNFGHSFERPSASHAPYDPQLTSYPPYPLPTLLDANFVHPLTWSFP